MRRVIEVEAQLPYTLALTFTDGRRVRIDIAHVLRGQIFEPLREPVFFTQARVAPDFGSVVWPNGADLSPEYLEEAASAQALPER